MNRQLTQVAEAMSSCSMHFLTKGAGTARQLLQGSCQMHLQQKHWKSFFFKENKHWALSKGVDMISMSSSADDCWNSLSTASFKLLEGSAAPLDIWKKERCLFLYNVFKLLIFVWKTLFHLHICRSTQQLQCSYVFIADPHILQWSSWQAVPAPFFFKNA